MKTGKVAAIDIGCAALLIHYSRFGFALDMHDERWPDKCPFFYRVHNRGLMQIVLGRFLFALGYRTKRRNRSDENDK